MLVDERETHYVDLCMHASNISFYDDTSLYAFYNPGIRKHGELYKSVDKWQINTAPLTDFTVLRYKDKPLELLISDDSFNNALNYITNTAYKKLFTEPIRQPLKMFNHLAVVPHLNEYYTNTIKFSQNYCKCNLYGPITFLPTPNTFEKGERVSFTITVKGVYVYATDEGVKMKLLLKTAYSMLCDSNE
jgi:hypothetical protein